MSINKPKLTNNLFKYIEQYEEDMVVMDTTSNIELQIALESSYTRLPLKYKYNNLAELIRIIRPTEQVFGTYIIYSHIEKINLQKKIIFNGITDLINYVNQNFITIRRIGGLYFYVIARSIPGIFIAVTYRDLVIQFKDNKENNLYINNIMKHFPNIFLDR